MPFVRILPVLMIQGNNFTFCFSGTDEERGLSKWRQHGSNDASGDLRTYDIPLIQKFLDRIPIFRYLPFCPRFSPTCGTGRTEGTVYQKDDIESQEAQRGGDNTVEMHRLQCSVERSMYQSFLSHISYIQHSITYMYITYFKCCAYKNSMPSLFQLYFTVQQNVSTHQL